MTKRHQIAMAFLLACVVSIGLACYCWSNHPFYFTVRDSANQFLPVSTVGYTSLKAGQLPLFNFYQFLGHPILETGYYPVMYPLWPVVARLSEILLGDLQRTWDLLCLSQLVLNALAVFWLCVLTLRMSPIVAATAAVGSMTLGIVLCMGAEWFYLITAVGFTASSILATDQLMRGCWPYRWALLLGLSLTGFWYSSNVQFFFYGLHFIFLIFLVASVSQARHEQLPVVKLLRMRIYPLIMAGIIAAGFIAPYFLAVSGFMKESARALGKQPEMHYYWLSMDGWAALRHAAWPSGYRPGTFWNPDFSFYIGPVPFAGSAFLPAMLLFPSTRKFLGAHLLGLAVAAIAAGILAMGKQGYLAALLYNIPPYNWFRHSIKWMPFAQLFFLLVGFGVFDRLLLTVKGRAIRGMLYSVALLATVGGSVRCIQVLAHEDEFIAVKFPLQAVTLAADPMFRHTGFCPDCSMYDRNTAAPVLGYNLASFYQLPSVAGYDPMARRDNLDASFNNWFQNFFMHPSHFNYNRLRELGVRYIRVLPEHRERTLTLLSQSWGAGTISYLGQDESLGCDVLEIEKVPPLVSYERELSEFDEPSPLSISHYEIRGNSVSVTIRNLRAVTPIFRWLYTPGFRAFVDGEEVPIRRGKAEREGLTILPRLSAGTHRLELRYAPTRIYLFFAIGFGVSLIATIATCMMGRRFKA